MRVEISGVRGEDLRVNMDGDLLRVSGVRQVPVQSDVRRLHQMEIAFGPFERAIRIAVPFDREQVSAHLEDGFLLVSLPKSGAKPRQIEVETA
ncbi:MAG: Hsp20/alpha crystallin family protein [Deltaproteobacteria bacterium]|nr:Hsp20/alpha crystallin family protein [Deltaproteobacteria bacterium]MBW2418504.1 Hsp20/alpha crystallin family protein [Deltaproteobacteria bacterium]